MHKTLLLVFIHGFKGGDDTFGTFPEHIRTLVSHALPKISVLAVQYPRFETRGELKECVARFREWLENKVIDLEVANQTPSPTIDPSVHVILIGHSMGGIVAAETLLLLASEKPILPSSSNNATNPELPNFPSNTTMDSSSSSTSHPNPSKSKQDTQHDDGEVTEPVGFLFPHIQAVVAFDTPYLGLAPEMVAHGLEGGHKMATNAWDTASEVASVFGWGSKSTSSSSAAAAPATSKSIGALPAPSNSMDAAAAPKWQSWGKYAMFAGAAGAVAAGGAAALYSQREKISAGWSWATSHLLFVGDLGKAENLRKRVENLERVVRERRLGGCGNFYTNLGRGAREGYGITESVRGKDRTFCNLPKKVKDRNYEAPSKNDQIEASTSDKTDNDGKSKLQWIKTVNDKAKDETTAHVSMFFPRENPGYYILSTHATEVMANWIDHRWYESSTGPASSQTPANVTGFDDATSELGSTHDTTIESEEFQFDAASDSVRVDEHNTFQPSSLGKDWEGLEEREHEHDDSDVEMREEQKRHEAELEDSVVIETMRSPERTTPTGSLHLKQESTSEQTQSHSEKKDQEMTDATI